MTHQTIFKILHSLNKNEWHDIANASFSPLNSLNKTFEKKRDKELKKNTVVDLNSLKSKHLIIYEHLCKNRTKLVAKTDLVFEKLCVKLYLNFNEKNSKKLAKLLSEFYKKIEPVIAKLKYLYKAPELASQISLLNFYTQNNFQEVFNEYNKKLQNKLISTQYLSKELYYKYEYFKTLSIHHKQKNLKGIDKPLIKSLELLADFYYLNTLKFACAILNYNLIFKKNKTFPQFQKPLYTFSNPIIQSFLTIYNILEEEYLNKDPIHAVILQNTLNEVEQILYLLKNIAKNNPIEKEDIKSIYQLLLNICRFNLSFIDNSFFMMFKKVVHQMINQEMITERKTMDARLYKAIIEVFSYGTFYDEAISFSQKYAPNLELEIKQNFETYCKALTLYLASKPEESYRFLIPILKKEKDAQLYIAIQKLQIKLCFALINNLKLDTPVALEKSQERLYKYILRKQKELPEREVLETKSFISLSKHIYKNYSMGKASIKAYDFKKNPIHAFDVYWIDNMF
ncbi:MAG: hypothetical protein ACPGVH_03905 [Chitinophagales bacterium]